VTVVNRIVAGGVGAVMSAFGSAVPLAGLALFALLAAIVVLLVIRAASNQPKIAAVKRSIRAALFEIRLFNDDLRAILRAQGEIARHNLTYLRLSLVPMIWVLLPLALLMAHLHAYYGYGGLQPGNTALVTVRMAEGWRPPAGADGPAGPALTLVAPPGLRVETPRVWAAALREASWRIGADRDGDYDVIVRLEGETFAKRVQVSNARVSRSPVRPAAGLGKQLLHPAEPPLPAGSLLDSITVTYPERGISILGRDTHWMIVFFALTMGFGFALKGRFGVML
jgi:hypothetical protein